MKKWFHSVEKLKKSPTQTSNFTMTHSIDKARGPKKRNRFDQNNISNFNASSSRCFVDLSDDISPHL